MIRWLHDNNLTHPLLATIYCLPFFIAGAQGYATNAAWVGAWSAIMFYWSREVAQVERNAGAWVASKWWIGFDFREWKPANHWDLWPVVVLECALAFLITYLF